MNERNPIPERHFVLRIPMSRERKGLMVLAARMRGQKLDDWVNCTLDAAALDAKEKIDARPEAK